MSNRLSQLLAAWHPQKDELEWVLATIVATDGSSYRKPGAMMIINSLGQYFGLLSGGCLESDIMRQARRCWDTGRNRIIQYDMREEEDLSWQLGLGCGGLVRILLQPVSRDNQYLQLDAVQNYLQGNQPCYYRQVIDEDQPCNQVVPAEQLPAGFATSPEAGKSQVFDAGEGPLLVHSIGPAPHLVVFGGGVDARPVVSIAAELGWQVIVVDPRTGYARDSHFTGATQVIRQPLDQLQQADWLQEIDMAVIMSHNIDLDGQALALVQRSSAGYVGMLGPAHRTERVLAGADMTRDDLSKPLANPVGLRLGGELPESIALSILAEAHAFIERADGHSISGMIGR